MARRIFDTGNPNDNDALLAQGIREFGNFLKANMADALGWENGGIEFNHGDSAFSTITQLQQFFNNSGFNLISPPKGGIGFSAGFGGTPSNPNSLPSTLGGNNSGFGALLKNPNMYKALLAAASAMGGGENVDLSKIGFGDDGNPIGVEDLANLNPQNRGRRRGGGGGGGGNQVMGDSFINNLLSDPDAFGQLNPEFLNNISFLQDQQLGNFSNFNNTINGLAALYADQIGGDDLIAGLMGGPGGFGGGGGGFSFGGGGGGIIDSIPQSTIEELMSQLPEFQARDIRTELPQLDPRLARELDTVKESQLADFGARRQETLSDLTAGLFGKGFQRSDVAGEAIGRGLEGLERTRLAILSEDIGRRLGVRESEAGRRLQGDLASLASEASTFGDRLRAITGIRTTEISADAGVKSSANSARASMAGSAAAAGSSMFGSRMGALASIFGDRIRGLTDIFGTQAGSLTSGFNTQTGGISNFADLFGNLALGESGQEIEKMLGLGNIANDQVTNQVRRQDINAQRSVAMARLQEAIASRLQSGILTREEFDLRRDLARMGADTDLQIAGRNDTETWERLLSAIALGAGAYFGG